MLGLAGETGEAADVVKKGLRDEGSNADLADLLFGSGGGADRWADLVLELGDVAYYLIAILGVLELTLPQLLGINHKKLADRMGGKWADKFPTKGEDNV